MRFDIIRQPLGIVMMQFFLLMLLFWHRAELFPGAIELRNMSSGFALGGIVDNFMTGTGLYDRLVTMFIVSINAVLIARIVTSNMVLGVRTFIPMLIYLAVSSGLYVSSHASGYLAAMLTIQGSYYFIRGFKRIASFDFMFRGGLLFGLAPLLGVENVILCLLILTAMILFRRSMRETIVAFVGFVMPTAVYSYIYWGMGYPFAHVATWGWQSFEILNFREGYITEIGALVLISLVILVVFLSLGTFFANLQNIRNRAARIYIYFLVMLLLFMTLFVVPCRSSSAYALIAIALSVVMPLYFVRHRNKTSEVLYLLLIGVVVVLNIIPFLF